jgi:hypothetical protein
MAVTLYKSTDTSAPSLTGAVGSLVALLDAILVNGYGSQSAAGWTIAYTATNKRDYKQGSGSNGYYLDVDDSAPTTAKEARMRGYETMSALATGTQAFPTSAQSSFGVVCRKSNTADSTTRPWYCIADATCFYLFVDTGDFTGPNYSCGFMFGDFFSYKSGDIYNTAIIGRNAENTNSDNNEWLQVINSSVNALISTAWPAGHYVDRHWTGIGGSLLFSKFVSLLAGISGGTGGNNAGSSISLCAYPNGPDGALELSPIWIGHQGNVRGYLKGLWCPLHFQPCGHGDTFTGAGNMAGKSFLALNMRNGNVAGSGLLGQIVVETSNTWS